MWKLATATGVAGYDYWDKRYYVRTWVWVAMWAAVIVAFFVGLITLLVYSSRAAGRASCHTYARVSGYSTRFTVQHFLDDGVCFVRLSNGHYLPSDKVIGYTKVGK